MRRSARFSLEQCSATLRLFGANYSQNEETEHIDFVVTSYCLKYDTVAVHMFQSKLCSFLCVWLKELLFWCCLKVKSTKNISLCYHKDDFGMDAKWYFYAMSHGKVHVTGLEEQLKARNTRKFAKLSQGVDQDTQTTS
jgi:hypothetical protein